MAVSVTLMPLLLKSPKARGISQEEQTLSSMFSVSTLLRGAGVKGRPRGRQREDGSDSHGAARSVFFARRHAASCATVVSLAVQTFQTLK